MFPAYMRAQVFKLVSHRLATLPGPVFEPNAIEFCSRKVANGNGDMRRALEAAGQALDILVAEEQEKQLQQETEKAPAVIGDGGGVGLGDNEIDPVKGSLVVPLSRRVGMRHMASALSRVTGGIGASNDNVSAIKKLPVPQQLLMCTVGKLLGETLGRRGLAVKAPSSAGAGATSNAAAKFIGHSGVVSDPVLFAPEPSSAKSLSGTHRRRSSSIGGGGAASGRKHDLNLGELELAHAALCKRVGVTSYSSMEFATATDVLCTLGLVELSGGRVHTLADRKKQRVMLRVAEDDVLMALVDVPVLKDVVGVSAEGCSDQNRKFA